MSFKKINLIIPMSGSGRRYQAAGYREPKPLIPVSGQPMISRVLSHFPPTWPCHFILSEEHRATNLSQTLLSLRPQAKLTYIPPHTKGPSFALQSIVETLPQDEAAVVSYCDYGMVWDSTQFEKFVTESDCDACLISYRGFHAHYLHPTMYAYSRLDGERVVEVKEKGCFTNNRENEFASCGAYYFKSIGLLTKALQFQMDNDMQLSGEFYTSLTIQALLLMDPDASVRIFEIPGFFQWGTPTDLKEFEYWEKTFFHLNRNRGQCSQVDQVLIPMAGLGSRFSSLTKTPKPMIPIEGIPLFEKAIESLPHSKQPIVVTLASLNSKFQLAKNKKFKTIPLSKTPAGQALTVQAGLKALDLKKEVIVSACDHAIVLNPTLWTEFRRNPPCDAAIFTVKNYPGVARTPKSYAYVVTEESSDLFLPVRSVSVKKTVSDQPSNDNLLVGTFWFRNAGLLKMGIDLLLVSKKKVNKEYYLDSIFEELIKKGFSVRNIPLDGFICWGDPEAMAESLYWQEQFSGQKIQIRSRWPNLTD